MTVTIEKDEIVIRAKIEKPLRPSASGKTLLVATSGGNIPTAANVDGKPVVVGLNAYVKR